MKAIVCGGGTGGHIYPALSIASRLRDQAADVLYMGAVNSTEAKLAQQSGFAFLGVSACGLHKRSPRLVRDLAVNYRGYLQARNAVRDYEPDIVIGTGGYAEAPVVKAAQSLHIPTLLHEQNAFPGLANRLLAKKADAVCLTFAAAADFFPHRERLHNTGLPVRRQILTANRAAAYDYFNIPLQEQSMQTLLITGGSIGASSINRAASAAYDQLLSAGLRVVHICGHNDYYKLKQKAPQHPHLVLLPYLNEMEHALCLADLAISRAGASFLAEAACVGLPLLIVPYPYATNDHQRYNAQALAEVGAAQVIEDGALNGQILRDRALALFTAPERLKKMAQAARALGVDDAAERIVAIAETLCEK